MKVVEDTGSIERARQVAENPDEYFARGRDEVRAEIRRSYSESLYAVRARGDAVPAM